MDKGRCHRISCTASCSLRYLSITLQSFFDIKITALLLPPFQLLMVVHFKNFCNTYGSLAAYIVAFLVRLSGGEPVLGLPAFIQYPGYDPVEDKQLFPFRTMAMLFSLITLIFVSWYSKWIFETGRLAPQYDYFKCVVNIPGDLIRVDEPSEVGEQVRDICWPYSLRYKISRLPRR